MDILNKEQRHRCMSAIKGKDTKPELLVQTESSAASGASGYSLAQIQDGDFRERMFLAWTSRMQVFCSS